MNKKYVSLLAGAGLIASLALALPAFAETQASGNAGLGVGINIGMQGGFRGGPGPARIPGVFGTVTAVNGTTLTVTSKAMQRNSSTTTSTVYTVNAANATVYKGKATSTVASIAVNDGVLVQGTVSGDNVTATVIRDNVGAMVNMRGGEGFGEHNASSSHFTAPTSGITGNGEPVIAGSITAVSGTTLTVGNASNVTYSVDVSNAKIVENGTTTAVTNLAVGDNVIVQGVVNDNAITASSVIDQGMPKTNNGNSTSTPHSGPGSAGGGFFGMIGGFFKKIFGF